MSVLPPAPNGTITVTGRVGQTAARSGPASAQRLRSPRARRAVSEQEPYRPPVAAGEACFRPNGRRILASLAYCFRSAGKIGDDAAGAAAGPWVTAKFSPYANEIALISLPGQCRSSPTTDMFHEVPVRAVSREKAPPMAKRKRLAVMITTNLEYWGHDEGHAEAILSRRPRDCRGDLPGNVYDNPNYTWREYGQRVGVGDVRHFDHCRVPSTCTMNAKMVWSGAR